MAKYSWVVSKSPSMAMHCKRCGERYYPNLPIAIDLYVALMKAFMQQHKDCQEVG